MMKTYLYITEKLEENIRETARKLSKTKAEVMRQALEKGIEEIQTQGTASGEIMLKLAEIGKRNSLKGPKDSSRRIDELLWSKNWNNE